MGQPYPLKHIKEGTTITDIVAAYAYNQRINALAREVWNYLDLALEKDLNVLCIHPGIINGGDLAKNVDAWSDLAVELQVDEVWVSGIHMGSGLRSQLTAEALQPKFFVPVRAVGLAGHDHTGQQAAWLAEEAAKTLQGFRRIVVYNFCGATHLGRNCATMWRHLEHRDLLDSVLLLPIADEQSLCEPVRLTKNGNDWGNTEWEYNLLEGEVARHLEMGSEELLKSDGQPSDVVTVAQAMEHLEHLCRHLQSLGESN